MRPLMISACSVPTSVRVRARVRVGVRVRWCPVSYTYVICICGLLGEAPRPLLRHELQLVLSVEVRVLVHLVRGRIGVGVRFGVRVGMRVGVEG